MGDKQIHPPHGQGAFDPVGPSTDAVPGSQVTGVVTGGKQAHPPHGIGANSNGPSTDAVPGSQVTGVVATTEAIDKVHKAVKIVVAAFTGATVAIVGSFFASRDAGPRELVADAAPAVEEFLPRTDTQPKLWLGNIEHLESEPARPSVVVVSDDSSGDIESRSSNTLTSGAANDDAVHEEPMHATHTTVSDPEDEDLRYDESSDETSDGGESYEEGGYEEAE